MLTDQARELREVVPVEHYPSLVEVGTLLTQVRDRPALIALDRDGTLVPYADRPENALVDDELRTILTALTTIPATIVAVVSARSLAQLERDFGGINMILAGNYGLEIRYPGSEPLLHPAAVASRPHIRAIIQELAALTGPLVNGILEDHGLSACLHFHEVPAEKLDDVHQFVADLAKRFDDVKVKRLPTSYDFLPAVSHGKGDALATIKATLMGEPDRPCIFCGDSEPDESAFEWVNSRSGLSVKVGSGRLKSCAQYGLTDVASMRQFLQLLPDHIESLAGQ
jgi:trehalose 6-phosphate phosphatase